MIDLYNVLKKKIQISLRNYAYCLDWLFLIDAVIINDEGSVVLCT
ncbi:TPA: ABC-three component system middle component 6 [Listeria monocytogenes]